LKGLLKIIVTRFSFVLKRYQDKIQNLLPLFTLKAVHWTTRISLSSLIKNFVAMGTLKHQ
jgi:hypothetical protein